MAKSPQLDDVDGGDRSHREILVAGAQASPATRRRFHSVSKGQQYLQFFGSDALKRLHGCAIAEADRGADSPCAGLAEPLRRPQIGFGNPHAPIVFLRRLTWPPVAFTVRRAAISNVRDPIAS